MMYLGVLYMLQVWLDVAEMGTLIFFTSHSDAYDYTNLITGHYLH